MSVVEKNVNRRDVFRKLVGLAATTGIVGSLLSQDTIMKPVGAALWTASPADASDGQIFNIDRLAFADDSGASLRFTRSSNDMRFDGYADDMYVVNQIDDVAGHGRVIFATGPSSTAKMAVKQNGCVAIGNTSIAASDNSTGVLDVTGFPAIRLRDPYGLGKLFDIAVDSGLSIFQVAGPGSFRMDGNSGNVGIGNVGVPGFKLDVGGRMRVRQGGSSAGIWFYQTTPAADRAFVGMVDDTHVGLWGNTGAAWSVSMDTTSGNVGIGTTSPNHLLHLGPGAYSDGFFWYSFSSIRGKENIEPLSDGVDVLKQLHPVSYNYKKTPAKRTMGFIAEEVGKVLPTIVDWDEDQPGYADSYNHIGILAITVQAVKQQQMRIEQLATRNSEQQTQIEEMKMKFGAEHEALRAEINQLNQAIKQRAAS